MCVLSITGFLGSIILILFLFWLNCSLLFLLLFFKGNMVFENFGWLNILKGNFAAILITIDWVLRRGGMFQFAYYTARAKSHYSLRLLKRSNCLKVITLLNFDG